MPLQAWTATPSGKRELRFSGMCAPVCSLFTIGSESRAAGESPDSSQDTRSPRMLSSPTAPFMARTIYTPQRCPSSHFPPRTSRAQLVLSGSALVPPRLFRLPDWTPLRTVVMPHLPPDTSSVPTHLGPSLKAMSRSRWDSLPRTTSAESQGRNDLVTGTKPFQALCQKPRPQDQVG